tara:strand:- start:286 stop:843 length:558 start_codon:yes stop_codon:yes gene_type:complete
MNKFKTLFEGNFQRYQGGGFLTGDLVRIRPDILTSEWAKMLGLNVVEQVKKFIESDLNIRVSSVKTLRPQVSGGTQQDVGASNEYFADVCLEKAPGLFLDFLELPTGFLEQIDTGINLSPIPDSQKREGEVTIKPEELELEAGENPFVDPVDNTKSKEGDKSLPTADTKQPNALAATSYTAGYMG